MRIHSSSLAFTPVGLNQKVGGNNSAQNKGDTDLSVAKDTPNQNPPSTQEQIKKTLDSVSQNLDLPGQDNLIEPINSRTLRALTAYTQEFNAPLQSQRAELITGIDAYA